MQEKSVQKRTRGHEGEDFAAEYLKNSKFKVIERNYRSKMGEIDIIAKREKTLYFFEVKARGAGSLIDPFEAVTPQKQQRIRRTAEYYILKNPKHEKLPCSFGVIGIDCCVEPPAVECILDAFE